MTCCDVKSHLSLSVVNSRTDLIDEGIEKAVATMQSVIELGRYIRDAKVMPVKVRKECVSCHFNTANFWQ